MNLSKKKRASSHQQDQENLDPALAYDEDPPTNGHYLEYKYIFKASFDSQGRKSKGIEIE
jgi:hypothetical protein